MHKQLLSKVYPAQAVISFYFYKNFQFFSSQGREPETAAAMKWISRWVRIKPVLNCYSFFQIAHLEL